MVDNEKIWLAAVTRAKQEKRIKERLDGMRIENFIPLRTEVRQWKSRRRKVTVSLLPNLVFLHTDPATGYGLVNEYGFRMRFMRRLDGSGPLVVPDKQMEDFIFLLGCSDEQVSVVQEAEVARGDRVRVTEGLFAGIEGEAVRLGGRRRVVVRLEGIVSLLTAEIPLSCLEKIE